MLVTNSRVFHSYAVYLRCYVSWIILSVLQTTRNDVMYGLLNGNDDSINSWQYYQKFTLGKFKHIAVYVFYERE